MYSLSRISTACFIRSFTRQRNVGIVMITFKRGDIQVCPTELGFNALRKYSKFCTIFSNTRLKTTRGMRKRRSKTSSGARGLYSSLVSGKICSDSQNYLRRNLVCVSVNGRSTCGALPLCEPPCTLSSSSSTVSDTIWCQTAAAKSSSSSSRSASKRVFSAIHTPHAPHPSLSVVTTFCVSPTVDCWTQRFPHRHFGAAVPTTCVGFDLLQQGVLLEFEKYCLDTCDQFDQSQPRKLGLGIGLESRWRRPYRFAPLES
jgi:hypothetical protein